MDWELNFASDWVTRATKEFLVELVSEDSPAQD